MKSEEQAKKRLAVRSLPSAIMHEVKKGRASEKAEWKLGEWLEQREKHQGARTPTESKKGTPLLSELNLNKKQSHKYQQIKKIPKAKQHNAGLEVKNNISKYLIDAEWKLGEWLEQNIQHQGGNLVCHQVMTNKNSSKKEPFSKKKPKLIDMNLNKKQSHKYQQIKKIPKAKQRQLRKPDSVSALIPLQKGKTQEEIAKTVGFATHKSVGTKLKEIQENIAKLYENSDSEIEPKYEFLREKVKELFQFSPQLYNIWRAR